MTQWILWSLDGNDIPDAHDGPLDTFPGHCVGEPIIAVDGTESVTWEKLGADFEEPETVDALVNYAGGFFGCQRLSPHTTNGNDFTLDLRRAYGGPRDD